MKFLAKSAYKLIGISIKEGLKKVGKKGAGYPPNKMFIHIT